MLEKVEVELGKKSAECQEPHYIFLNVGDIAARCLRDERDNEHSDSEGIPVYPGAEEEKHLDRVVD